MGHPDYVWYSHHYQKVGWFSMRLTNQCKLGEQCRPSMDFLGEKNTTLLIADEPHKMCGTVRASAGRNSTYLIPSLNTEAFKFYLPGAFDVVQQHTYNKILLPVDHETVDKNDTNLQQALPNVDSWIYDLGVFVNTPQFHAKFCEARRISEIFLCQNVTTTFFGTINLTTDGEPNERELSEVVVSRERAAHHPHRNPTDFHTFFASHSLARASPVHLMYTRVHVYTICRVEARTEVKL